MKDFKIGLQLYSIRDELKNDLDGALKRVKEMGYDYVETAGLGDIPVATVVETLKKYDLTAISAHMGPAVFEQKGEEVALKELKDLGVSYCVIPWYTVDEYFTNWDNTIEKFKNFGKVLKDNGFSLLYHNHDFEFKTIDGEFILEKMYKAVGEDLIAPEYDLCWVHYAGQDPAEYILKQGRNLDVIHLKDFVCEKLGGGPVYDLIGMDNNRDGAQSRQESGFKYKPVGEGIQDWKKILDACEKLNVTYLIVEQDSWYDENPLDCAERSRKYLKEKFGL